MRAYPGWYQGDSVYALFPLTIPSENRKILQGMGKEKEYSYDPPKFTPPPVPVTTWKGVVDILKDQKNFKVPCMILGSGQGQDADFSKGDPMSTS